MRQRMHIPIAGTSTLTHQYTSQLQSAQRFTLIYRSMVEPIPNNDHTKSLDLRFVLYLEHGMHTSICSQLINSNQSLTQHQKPSRLSTSLSNPNPTRRRAIRLPSSADFRSWVSASQHRSSNFAAGRRVTISLLLYASTAGGLSWSILLALNTWCYCW